MSILSVVLLLALGAIVGAAVGLLVARLRTEGGGVRSANELAVLKEQLAERDRRLAEALDQAKTFVAETRVLQQQLSDERSAHAAATQAVEEIPRLRDTLAQRDAQVAELNQKLASLQEQCGRLETTLQKERTAVEEKLALVGEAQTALSDAFKALSADALKSNNQSFLDLAKTTLEKFQEAAKGDLEKRHQAIEQLVKPVAESLGKFDAQVQELEKTRVGAYKALLTQVDSLGSAQAQLQKEAANLVKALRAPSVRGRWGEMHLRRVVEMAGMVNYCDFSEQQSVDTEEGRQRPDMIINLPGGKSIVVDAKTPLAAYLDSLDVEDETLRREKLQDHARQVRDQIKKLSLKSYWDQFTPAPEFVVLFLPGESYFSAALQQDPSLIEQGVNERVILATPTTLISLLKAVAYGWRQENLAANAKQIADLGKELYKRILDLGGHMVDVGRKLGGAVESYNKVVGTLETRVLVSARRFRDLDTTGTEGEIESPAQIDTTPREIRSVELLPGIGKQSGET